MNPVKRGTWAFFIWQFSVSFRRRVCSSSPSDSIFRCEGAPNGPGGEGCRRSARARLEAESRFGALRGEAGLPEHPEPLAVAVTSEPEVGASLLGPTDGERRGTP